MRVWNWIVLSLVCTGCALHAAGPKKNALRGKMTKQASSLPDIYYEEVLNNLAMVQTDPSRLPHFSDPQTSRTSIADTGTISYGLFADLISSAPTGVLTLFNKYLLDRQSATVTESRRDSGEWAALTANDPDKLFTIRAAYHRVIGVANPEDQEILAEFYFRHFQITDEALNDLRTNHADIYDKIGDKFEKLKGIEYLTAEGFELRLGQDDVLGKDDFARYRRTLLKTFRMSHEPAEFVSDEDTHHLLYATALTPGWIGTGQKHDVPKDAAYVGQFGKTFVWVMPNNLESLTRLTLAILDIHTFRSERIGGSRVQPGILPR